MVMAGCRSGETPKLPINGVDIKPGSQAEQLFDEEAIILPFPGRQRYVQGPHNTGLKPDGVKDAIDIAPIENIPCLPGEDKIYTKEPVISMVTGEVIKVGNEKDKTDPNHSLVEVQRKSDGLRFGQLHISKIAEGIIVGKQIKAGETIGWAGCTFPLGGRTDLIHSHIYVHHSLGGFLEIVNLSEDIAGYKFDLGGNLISPNSEKVIANSGDTKTNILDNDIKYLVKDLNKPKPTVASFRTPVLAAPAPTPMTQEVKIESKPIAIPTSTPIPSSTPLPRPTETPKPNVVPVLQVEKEIALPCSDGGFIGAATIRPDRLGFWTGNQPQLSIDAIGANNVTLARYNLDSALWSDEDAIVYSNSIFGESNIWNPRPGRITGDGSKVLNLLFRTGSINLSPRPTPRLKYNYDLKILNGPISDLNLGKIITYYKFGIFGVEIVNNSDFVMKDVSVGGFVTDSQGKPIDLLGIRNRTVGQPVGPERFDITAGSRISYLLRTIAFDKCRGPEDPTGMYEDLWLSFKDIEGNTRGTHYRKIPVPNLDVAVNATAQARPVNLQTTSDVNALLADANKKRTEVAQATGTAFDRAHATSQAETIAEIAAVTRTAQAKR